MRITTILFICLALIQILIVYHWVDTMLEIPNIVDLTPEQAERLDLKTHDQLKQEANRRYGMFSILNIGAFLIVFMIRRNRNRRKVSG